MLFRRPRQIVAFLAALTAVGPISTDMYLPAFPAMRAELHGTNSSSQMTLAAWFVGLALGQISSGPAADHFGRRKPLLIGTLLYGLASIGCALSSSFTWLSVFRVFAALGGAASLVIPRAIIRDLVRDDLGATRLIATLVLVMGAVPVLAPTLGSVIAAGLGWRAIFWLAALYGFACSIAIWRKLPDTLPRARRKSWNVTAVLFAYGSILKERTFLTHALQGAFATFSLFALLGGMPLVFEEGFGLTPTRFGLLFMLNAGTYIIGAQANSRLMTLLGAGRLLTIATAGLLATCAVLLLLSVAWPAVWTLASTIACFMFLLGIVLPGCAVGSILPHAGQAGSASALYGTIVFLIGAGGTVLVGVIASSGPAAMAWLMVLGAVGACVADVKRPVPRAGPAGGRRGHTVRPASLP